MASKNTIYFKKCFILYLSVAVCFCESTEKATLESGNQDTVVVETNLTSANRSTNNGENSVVLKKNGNDSVEIVQESNKTQKFIKCLQGMGNSVVQLTNDTELIKLLQPDLKVTDKDIPGLCVLVLFYSKYCPFSSLVAPHYNALPRAFPDIKIVAINAMMYHLFNTQNGIVGVPSLMLFHGGRPITKFNDSVYTLEQFSKFISKYTGLTAAEKSAVTSSDFAGPIISNPSKEFDILLIISWLFIVLCGCYYFTKSKWWHWIIETVQNNWRDSEVHAQHEHLD